MMMKVGRKWKWLVSTKKTRWTYMMKICDKQNAGPLTSRTKTRLMKWKGNGYSGESLTGLPDKTDRWSRSVSGWTKTCGKNSIGRDYVTVMFRGYGSNLLEQEFQNWLLYRRCKIDYCIGGVLLAGQTNGQSKSSQTNISKGDNKIEFV